MFKEVMNYIKYDCKICINDKDGIKLDIKNKIILTKGPKERFVMDGFKLQDIIVEKTSYSLVVKIIYHFSKFIKSYAVKENIAKNILLCLKDFYYYIGIPQILQTGNGVEYKNRVISHFCNEHNITHIFSSPRYPQSNGVLEVAYKETSKYIINSILENDGNIDLKDSLLEGNNIHNNNLHWATKFRPADLINNTNDDIYKTVVENIKKKYNPKNLDTKVCKSGKCLKIKKDAYKVGRNIKLKKSKNKKLCIPAIFVKIDIDMYDFKKNEEYFIEPSYVATLSKEQWKILIEVCERHANGQNVDGINIKKKKI